MQEAVGPVMHGRQLDRLKQLLLEKQRELLSGTGDAGHRVPAASASREDSFEEPNAAAEAELQIRLRQTDGLLLRAIEDAWGRIRQGTYGLCESCGAEISSLKLEAEPWTHHCRECEERRSA